jgi:hypothetical protein
VSRIERAQVAARVTVIQALLAAYRADEQTSAELLEIAEVMREQLAHIAVIAERPNVDVQVVPFSEGAYAGTSPFVILGFEGEDDVVYLETMAGSIYPETEIA